MSGRGRGQHQAPPPPGPCPTQVKELCGLRKVTSPLSLFPHSRERWPVACRALLQVRQGPCSLTGAKNSPIVVPHPRGLSQGCACEEAGLPHRREGLGKSCVS